jgi:hypothetical protein
MEAAAWSTSGTPKRFGGNAGQSGVYAYTASKQGGQVKGGQAKGRQTKSTQ